MKAPLKDLEKNLIFTIKLKMVAVAETGSLAATKTLSSLDEFQHMHEHGLSEYWLRLNLRRRLLPDIFLAL
jgi:hypothetical protein